jgi:hypothetical protein
VWRPAAHSGSDTRPLATKLVAVSAGASVGALGGSLGVITGMRRVLARARDDEERWQLVRFTRINVGMTILGRRDHAARQVVVAGRRPGARVRGVLGAPWLVRHHELVVEAAIVLCDRLARELGVVFDRDLVLLRASLHDVGKVFHPEEMTVAGSRHEAAGRQLLVDRGVAASIARFCVTHAAWDGSDAAIEDMLVPLADKAWKGKRDDALEQFVIGHIATQTHREPWDVFDYLDAICEAIAAGGPERLSRSIV